MSPPRDAALDAAGLPRVDFFLAGAMKCGTTTLRRALAAHPEIHVPEREVHFFGSHRRYLSVWRDGRIDLDALERVYGRHLRSDRRLVGEKTPNYVVSSVTLERLHRFHPEARIVLMVRDPVARAQSHWNHNLRRVEIGRRPPHTVAPTFADQVLRDQAELAALRDPEAEVRDTNVLWRGLYAIQLRRLLRFFPRERVLVGVLEDLRADPGAFVRRLLEFLGAPFDPACVEAARAGEAAAPGHTRNLTEIERLALREFYAESVRDLELMLGRKLPWDAFSDRA